MILHQSATFAREDQPRSRFLQLLHYILTHPVTKFFYTTKMQKSPLHEHTIHSTSVETLYREVPSPQVAQAAESVAARWRTSVTAICTPERKWISEKPFSRAPNKTRDEILKLVAEIVLVAASERLYTSVRIHQHKGHTNGGCNPLPLNLY
jgi:hypothetical protein